MHSQQGHRALIKKLQLLALAACILLMQGMTQHKFRDLMAVDKKVLDGALRLILLKGPLGSCVFTADFDAQALDQTLASFCEA